MRIFAQTLLDLYYRVQSVDVCDYKRSQCTRRYRWRRYV